MDRLHLLAWSSVHTHTHVRTPRPVTARGQGPNNAGGLTPANGTPLLHRMEVHRTSSGTRIAGPAAKTLLTGKLDSEAVHWLQTNFLKTELELGHCLRLPAEGPCECDLVLTCPKFVTTSEYPPRIRARLDIEDQLIADAERRSWAREVERHQDTKRRLQQLLADLDETPGEPPSACQRNRSA
jgi:hypothetical protein